MTGTKDGRITEISTRTDMQSELRSVYLERRAHHSLKYMYILVLWGYAIVGVGYIVHAYIDQQGKLDE